MIPYTELLKCVRTNSAVLLMENWQKTAGIARGLKSGSVKLDVSFVTETGEKPVLWFEWDYLRQIGRIRAEGCNLVLLETVNM